MSRNIVRKRFLLFYVFLIIIEIAMVYLLLNAFLTKDFISPNDVTFYEYLLTKLNNIV